MLKRGMVGNGEDEISAYEKGYTPWPITYSLMPDELKSILEKCGVKNICLVGPGSYARTIPNELLVKIMNDPKQRADFLDFCHSLTAIRLSVEWGKTIYLPKEIFQMNKQQFSKSRIYEAMTIKKTSLEKMSDFFTVRINGYDEHMLNDVEGCKEGYIKMAELVPDSTETILDLGCGTGLELDEIFKRLPNVSVVGIDLTQVMLDKLRQKHFDKNIRLICGNYFDIELGENTFDAVISFQTMHHFSHDEKVGLYTKIHKALNSKGVYIECDYMVTVQSVEDELFAENTRLHREMNIPEGEFYHFDTPCTIDNQIAMFKKAGFSSTDMVWRMENTTIIIAKSSKSNNKK